jgi:propanol-preferring alcohol dehydrogenase
MRAMVLSRPGVVGDANLPRLRCEERPIPQPGPDGMRVRVEACGVCRTDLHVVEGDLPPRAPGIVPGHQVIGRVDALGAEARGFAPGDRVGVAWLQRACGACRFCTNGRENLCLSPHFTGWDVDGGYAEHVCVPAAFAYAVPEGPPARALAPLLCAGIIGYRAFVASGAGRGSHLGLYGFGGSAHIVIQIARHAGCEVSVFTREPVHAELARSLGAGFAGDSFDPPPRKLDAAILFAPAGELVPAALEALDRGGTLAVAGIHLSDVPPLSYQRHLFQERVLRSVTANTREDGRELLRLAEEIPIRTTTVSYPLERANEALADLKAGRFQGAAVLEIDPPPVRR